MDFNKLKVILVVTLAAFAALYLGIAAATAQTEAIAWISGALFLTLLLMLGRHVWALIPIFSVLGGTITSIPGYPAPWYAITPVVTFMLLARFLMRSRNFTYRFCWMDVLLIVQLLVLAQAFARNPTGLAFFGSSEVIGGRPYVDYSVAIFSYFILATVKTELRIVKRVIFLMIVFSLGDELLKGATGFSGTLSRIVGSFYSNVDYASYEAGAAYSFDIGTTRFTSLSGLGIVISQILFSFNRPLRCLFPLPPLQFLALGFAAATTLLSGFRSGLIKMGCFFVASTLIRRKPMDLVVGGAAAFVVLAMIIGTVGVKSLPNAAQRALSFLPVEVDENIRDSAEGSSEWRYEMWRLVLTSDRYIQNKMLGDGFGYSAAEHKAQMENELGTRQYQGDSIDMFIAKGSYHGWHVEAIRFVGVLGLVVGIIILFWFARAGWRVIQHHRNTDFQPYALFLCMPFLIEPFFTLFVFGSYKSSFITYIAMSGMLRVLYGLYLEDLRQRAHATVPTAAESDPVKRLPMRTRPMIPSRG